MKKALAVILAAAMACSMSLAAFAEPDGAPTNETPAAQPAGLTPDATITITGLDNGDTVNLYQVMQWESGTGWRLVAPFNTEEIKALTDIKKLTDPQKDQGTVELTKDTLEKIAAIAKNAKPVNDNKTVSGTSYTYNTSSAPGMYIALVEPVKAGTVYNPIVVSADYSTKNKTTTIDSSELIGTSEDQRISAVAKKKTVSVEKTEPKITNNIGDTYNFTVETTIPVYAKSFTGTYFTVSDEMSEHLDLVANSFKVETKAGATVTPSSTTVTDGAHGWTISFNDGYIKALAAPQEIVITYSAKLNLTKEEAAELPNVQQEKNEVTITFPNNPKDDTGKAVEKDDTREYTFTIDGKLLGNSGWNTTELVKVGLDQDGNPVESMISFSHGEEHAALNGAEFGVYKNKSDADAANKNYYTNGVFDGTVVSANGGLLYIPGLDAGTYYLKELSAPDGYIKDPNTHTIKIEATLDEETITEYYKIDNAGKVTWSKTDKTGTPYTYKVKVLKSYKVIVDGNEKTETEIAYSMELDGPNTSQSTIIRDSAAEIANTKGVELPSTGGMGTTIFYIIGSILVIGAGVILVTRRRMSAN